MSQEHLCAGEGDTEKATASTQSSPRSGMTGGNVAMDMTGENLPMLIIPEVELYGPC